jgi:transposase
LTVTRWRLRGENLESVSRGLGVTAATLSGWRDAFLAAGEASLSTRHLDAEALESGRLKAKLGEMLLERKLLEAKVAALEARSPGPLARRRSRP